MSDLVAYVANCPISCEGITRNERGGFIRDITTFNLGGINYELRQIESYVKMNAIEQNKLLGQKIHTTNIIVRSVPSNEVGDVKENVRDICWLLTLATGSKVTMCGFEYPKDSGKIQHQAVNGHYHLHRPLIDNDDGEAVRKFVELTWDKYQALKTDRKLKAIFDYTYKTAVETTVEIKALLSFVTLEGLKNTYAQVLQFPYHNGGYRKISTPPKPNLNSEPKYHFKELLTMMLADVGMSENLDDIISLRNEIIHSGLSIKPSNEVTAIHDSAQDVIREYLLRLLDYKGDYLIYSKACREHGTI